MYCLVEFTHDDETPIAIAHLNWIVGNSQCYWPPFWKNSTKLNVALKCGTKPDPNTWTIHSIHIVGNRKFGKRLSL